MSWDFTDKTDKSIEEISTTKPIVSTNTNKTFDFSPEKDKGKTIITIYGAKGVGKTSVAYMFPGKIVCISFDNKSLHPTFNLFKDKKEIVVYNGMRYFYEDEDLYTISSAENYEYLKKLISQKIKLDDKPDWIVIDGLDELSKMAEMVMRHMHGYKPFQGIANRSVWKSRKLVIRTIHRLVTDTAKKGVIYTTYSDKNEIIEEGTIITKKDVPRWADIVLEETDVVFFVYQEFNKEGVKVKLRVDTSKFDSLYKTGQVIDVTAKTEL